MTDQGPAPAPAAPSVLPAGFWRRVAAWLVDVILITGGAYLVGIFLWPDLMVETRTQTGGAGGAQFEIVTYALSAHGWVIHGVALWAYTALLESGPAQATLGKRALRLRVTGLDGGRISLLTASYRSWPLWLHGPLNVPAFFDVVEPTGALFGFSSFVGVAALAACLAIPFTRRRQGLHDMMARCLVVRRPRPDG